MLLFVFFFYATCTRVARMWHNCVTHVAHVLRTHCTYVARILHCAGIMRVPCIYRVTVVASPAALLSPLQLQYHRCSPSITAAAPVSPRVWTFRRHVYRHVHRRVQTCPHTCALDKLDL